MRVVPLNTFVIWMTYVAYLDSVSPLWAGNHNLRMLWGSRERLYVKVLCEVLSIICSFLSRQSNSRPEFIWASLFFFFSIHCTSIRPCSGDESVFFGSHGRENISFLIVLNSSTYLLAAFVKLNLLNSSIIFFFTLDLGKVLNLHVP